MGMAMNKACCLLAVAAVLVAEAKVEVAGEAVHATVFDDVDGDGRSSGRGEL